MRHYFDWIPSFIKSLAKEEDLDFILPQKVETAAFLNSLIDLLFERHTR